VSGSLLYYYIIGIFLSGLGLALNKRWGINLFRLIAYSTFTLFLLSLIVTMITTGKPGQEFFAGSLIPLALAVYGLISIKKSSS